MKNGIELSRPENNDIDNLKVYVANTTPLPVKDEDVLYASQEAVSLLNLIDTSIKTVPFARTTEKEGQTDIKLNPTSQDIILAKGNLSIVVPTGFLLLHNDLVSYMALQKKKKTGDSNSDSDGIDLSFLEGMSIGKSIANVFKTAFASPIVKANITKLMGFLTNPHVLAVVAGGAALLGMINYIKGSDDRKTRAHIEGLMQEYTRELTLEELKNIEGIDSVRDNFVRTYVDKYFDSLISGLKMETIAEGFGTILGGSLLETAKSLFGVDEEKDSPMYKLVEGLITELDTDDIEAMDGITDLRDASIKAYVRAYYNAQISALNAESKGVNTGNVINGILAGLFEGADTTAIGTSLLDVINELQKEMLTDEWIQEIKEDKSLKEARDLGVLNYINTYYMAQTMALQAEALGLSEGTEVRNRIKGFFTNAIASMDDTTFSSKLSEIITLFSEDIKPSNFVDDRSKGLMNETVYSFIDSFFDKSASVLLEADLEFNPKKTMTSSEWNAFRKQANAVSSSVNHVIMDALNHILVYNEIDEEHLNSMYQTVTDRTLDMILEESSKQLVTYFNQHTNFGADTGTTFASFTRGYLDTVSVLLDSTFDAMTHGGNIHITSEHNYGYNDTVLLSYLSKIESALKTIADNLDISLPTEVEPIIVPIPQGASPAPRIQPNFGPTASAVNMI